MKTSKALNAEKLNIWQCCGQYNAAGVKLCPICGKSRFEDHPSRTPHTKPECSKLQTLVVQSAASEILQKPSAKFHITIERHSPRPLDGDNFIGGCKQLRDAIAELLCKHGDSEDDGLEFEYMQIRSKIKKTVVKIQQKRSNV